MDHPAPRARPRPMTTTIRSRTYADVRDDLVRGPASAVQHPPRMVTTIRLATEEDAPAMARMLDADDIAEICTCPLGEHYLLVAEDPFGRLAALAVIRLQARCAELRRLVMTATDDDDILSDRMIEAAEALSVACGCERFEHSCAYRCN